MVEIPKRGGWGSAIWEKFPNNPVFFSDAFPKLISFTVDCILHMETALATTLPCFIHCIMLFYSWKSARMRALGCCSTPNSPCTWAAKISTSRPHLINLNFTLTKNNTRKRSQDLAMHFCNLKTTAGRALYLGGMERNWLLC